MFTITPNTNKAFGFKPSILGTATDAIEASPKLPHSLKHLAVIAILDPQRYSGVHRLGITSRNAAGALGVTESTLFRHLGDSGMSGLQKLGEAALFDEHRTPRYNALKGLAFDIVTDPTISLEDRVEQWAAAYATTANPGYIYQALSLFTNHGKDMLEQNANLIDHATGLLIGDEAQLNLGAGLQLTPLFGAIDVSEGGVLTPRFVAESIFDRLT